MRMMGRRLAVLACAAVAWATRAAGAEPAPLGFTDALALAYQTNPAMLTPFTTLRPGTGVSQARDRPRPGLSGDWRGTA